MHDIILESAAENFLRKLDNSKRGKVVKKIEKLKLNPRLGIPLVGNFKGLWKYRMEKYRFIYKIDDNKLVIVGVGLSHRKNAYK